MHYTVISFLTDIAQICFFSIKPRGNYCYYKPLIKPLGCLFSNLLDGGLIREGVLIERGLLEKGTYLEIKVKCLYFKVKNLYLYWISLSADSYLSCSPQRSSNSHLSWVQCYYSRKPEYPEKTCDAW